MARIGKTLNENNNSRHRTAKDTADSSENVECSQTGELVEIASIVIGAALILIIGFLIVFASAADFVTLDIMLLAICVGFAVIASLFSKDETKLLRGVFTTGATLCALCLVFCLCLTSQAKMQGAEDDTLRDMTMKDMAITSIKMPYDGAETVSEATKAVIAYRFDCESCKRLMDDLKTLQQRLEADGLGDVPFVCTRSDHGREIVAASNIHEVPCVLVSNGDGTWCAISVTTEEPFDGITNMTKIVFDVEAVAASVEAMVLAD